MSGNRKKWKLHASRRTAGGEEPRVGFAVLKFSVAAALFAALAYGGHWVCAKLGDILKAQCVVENVLNPEQIRITTTPHISAALVRELFALTNGCNLATMDFAEKREEILHTHPLIKTLSVARRLPDKLEIIAEERTPIARINCSEDVFKTSKGETVRRQRWDVTDEEGVVFKFKLGDSAMLPRIVWGAHTPAKVGDTLSGHALSAVRLAEINARKEFPNFRLDKIDVSGNTYMYAYFFSATDVCCPIKIDWNYIDPPSQTDQPHLRKALGEITDICNNRLDGPLGTTFIVHEDGRVTAKYTE